MALLNCNPLLPRRSRLQWYRGRASILPMFRSLLLLTILTSVVAHVVEERRLIRSGVPRSRVRRQRSPTLVRDPLSVLSWRTIRGGGDSSSSRLEISKEWCTYIQNIDASNRTFYYQDAQDEIQGPFTRQELKNWRSQLPMDLPIMLQPEKIKAGSSVTLLAHLLEDEQLYNMWRMDVNDGSRDPENCGYCVSPTADEYQEEVNAQIAARTASSAGAYGGLGSVGRGSTGKTSMEDGKGLLQKGILTNVFPFSFPTILTAIAHVLTGTGDGPWYVLQADREPYFEHSGQLRNFSVKSVKMKFMRIHVGRVTHASTVSPTPFPLGLHPAKHAYIPQTYLRFTSDSANIRDGEKFSEQPVEYAVVVGESHYLVKGSIILTIRLIFISGIGGAGTRRWTQKWPMSLQNKEELEKMRKIVKKKQQQELEQERKAGGANKTVKTRDQLILQQFAGCLDENDPARIAFLAGKI
eukprot:jgi/Bigna1/86637/estExt_fgenesh1_pg.C_120119